MDKPHKNLDVWKLSMDLVVEIYKETEGLPDAEKYGLMAQIRRAAISIPSNIAEGAARQTTKEFINFLHIAQASLSELETQIELAMRLNYITKNKRETVDKRMERIDKMITGLLRQLKQRMNSRDRLTPNDLPLTT